MPLRRLLSVLLLLCPRALQAQPAAPPPPVIAFEEQALVASGVTPGGRVVWFGVAREIEDYSATVVRRDRVAADEDGDGRTDGRITATLAGMRPLDDSPEAPERFSPRDIVAVVDPNRLEYSVQSLVEARP